MNLAIRGIEGQIAHGDSFHNDRFPDLKADYILANPPFNVSDWRGELLREDKRWKYGIPPVGNASFAWVQHMIYHLSLAGLAGFVLANGSMSSNQSGEGEIRRYRAEYYDRLQAVRDAGDWEGWLSFFLRGVAEVSREAANTARAILEMREMFRFRITAEMGRAAGNAHKVMDHLFKRPIVAVSDVRDLLGITTAGANNLVNRLVKIGLLREFTGYARNRRFRFEPYLRLFEEHEESRA